MVKFIGEYYWLIFGLVKIAIMLGFFINAGGLLTIIERRQMAIMQDRIQRTLREAGVTIVSSDNTYIESGISIGRDTVIYPFSFVGRDAEIGPSCVIGPYGVVPRSSILAEGVTVAGNVSPSSTTLDPTQ